MTKKNKKKQKSPVIKKSRTKPAKAHPIKRPPKAPKQEVSKRPPPTPEAIAKKQYMSNPLFYAELIRCQKAGKMSNELGKMFMLVSAHYCSKPNFSGYSYKDEMIASGIKACCEAFDKFNPKKSKNPFAFFTMVIHNSFLQVLNKEKRQQRIRDKILIENEMDPSDSYMDFLDSQQEQTDTGDFDDREDVKVANPAGVGFKKDEEPTNSKSQ